MHIGPETLIWILVGIGILAGLYRFKFSISSLDKVRILGIVLVNFVTLYGVFSLGWTYAEVFTLYVVDLVAAMAFSLLFLGLRSAGRGGSLLKILLGYASLTAVLAAVLSVITYSVPEINFASLPGHLFAVMIVFVAYDILVSFQERFASLPRKAYSSRLRSHIISLVIVCVILATFTGIVLYKERIVSRADIAQVVLVGLVVGRIAADVATYFAQKIPPGVRWWSLRLGTGPNLGKRPRRKQ